MSCFFGLCLFALVASGAVAGPADKVVYGTDDRKDYYELASNDVFRNVTKNSIVCLAEGLYKVNGRYDNAWTRSNLANTYRLGSRYSLCSDQKFFYDPALAFCSGTLIAPDRILTAGHCVNGANCVGKQMVFNFYVTSRDSQDYPNFPEVTDNDVYTCKDVYSTFDENNPTLDFAVIQLDRPVDSTRHQPAQLASSNDDLSISQSVTVLGCGSGIPVKIDEGGEVLGKDGKKVNFYADTDTFGGNSGSGIFTSTGMLIGVLNRGATDYVQRSGTTCKEVNMVNAATCNCQEVGSYAFHARDVIDCKTDADCEAQTVYKSNNCSRTCSSDSTTCTGLCIPANNMGSTGCLEIKTGTTYSAPSREGTASGEHYYTFTLQNTTLVTLDACDASFDAILTVFNSSAQVAQCDDSCGCADALKPRVVVELPAGSYRVRLEGFDEEEAGTYSLKFGCGDQFPSAGPTTLLSFALAISCLLVSFVFKH